MFERFTNRARKVMALANQEAQCYKFAPQKMSSLHILLGIVREGTGVACVVLRNLEIDLEKVHRECEKRLKRIKIIRKEDMAGEVVNFATEKARSLNHNYVGTEHLLLGILLQEKSRGAQILKNLGLKTENVQAEIMNLLGAGLSPLARKMIAKTEQLASIIEKKKKESSVKCEFFQAVETIMMEGRREDTYFKPAISGYGRNDVEKKITDFLKDKEFVHSNQSSLVILRKHLIRTTEYTIFYRDKGS